MSGLHRALPWIAVAGATIAGPHVFDLLVETQDHSSITQAGDSAMPPLWLLVPAICSVGIATAFQNTLKRRTIVAAGTLLLLVVLSFVSVHTLWVSLVFVGSCFGWLLLESNQGRERRGLIAACVVTIILSVAAWLRQGFLVVLLPSALDPDADGYLKYAMRARGYATMMREPLFVWMVQLQRLLGGDYTPTALRLMGVGISLGSIAVLFEVARRLVGLLIACIAASLYATSFFFCYTAVRGLREDLIILLFLVYCGVFVRAWGRKPDWLTYAFLGLVGAANSLLRLNSLMLMSGLAIVLFASSAYLTRLPFRRSWVAVLPILVPWLLVLPYLVYCRREYGSAFYTMNLHVRFYANEEFAGVRPDFPTREQFKQEGYWGGPMSMGDYLFRYHSVGEILSRSWKGTTRLYFTDIAKQAYAVSFSPPPQRPIDPTALMPLHYLGFVAMLWPVRRLLLGANVVFHAPMLFLVALPTFDPRLCTVAMVMGYIGVGAAVFSLVEGGRWVYAQAIDNADTSKTRSDAPPANRRKTHRRAKLARNSSRKQA